MSEFEAPKDDGKPRLHGWTSPKHDRFTLVSDTPCTRTEAVRLIQQLYHPDLANLASVELCDYEDDGPARRLGSVAVRITTADLGREIARSIAGGSFTVTMPAGRLGK